MSVWIAPHEGGEFGTLSLDGTGDDAHAVPVAHDCPLQILEVQNEVD